MFNFVLLCPKRWFQFNSSIVRIHFSSIMTLNNSKMIAETRSYIFRWRCRIRRRSVCLSSLLSFGRLRQRMLLKCVPHVQHDYCSSCNQSDHCFLLLSLPSSLLKLPRGLWSTHFCHKIFLNSIPSSSFSLLLFRSRNYRALWFWSWRSLSLAKHDRRHVWLAAFIRTDPESFHGAILWSYDRICWSR